MKTKLENAKIELIAWLNDECPKVWPPLEPYITADLSHDFAEKLRERLDNIIILKGQEVEELTAMEECTQQEKVIELRDFLKWFNENMENSITDGTNEMVVDRYLTSKDK